MNSILRLLNLRRNERPRLLNAALVIFLVSVNDGIVKSVAAAVFNIRVGAAYLPDMYIWIAVMFACSMATLSWMTAKLARQRLLFGLMAGIGLLLLFNSAALWYKYTNGDEPFSGFYSFLFVSSELARTLMGFQVWIVASGICYTSRAKVLFPLLAASAYLGDVFGGFAAGFLGLRLPSYQLYGLSVVNMIVVIGTLRPLVRRYFVAQTSEDEEMATLSENLRFFARSAYLRLLFVLSIAVFALYTAIHYVFNVVARHYYPTEHMITGFFGMFYGTAGVVTLLVTALALRLILRWLGTGNVYLWVCLIYAGVTLVLLALFNELLPVSIVALMFALNLISFLLLDSVVAPTYQVLIKLIPARNSDGTRMIMEGGFMLFGGLVGAGVTMLHARSILSLGELFALLTGLGVAMVAVGWRFKGAYTQVLVRAVREQDVDFDDDQAMASLVQVVSSSTEFPRSLLLHVDDGVRQMGIEILRQCPGPVVAQVCMPLVDHENPRIRSSALDAMGGDALEAEAVTTLLERLDDDDDEVCYSAAQAVRRFAEHQSKAGTLQQLPEVTYLSVVNTVLPHLADAKSGADTTSATLQVQFITILGILGHEPSAVQRRRQLENLLHSPVPENVIAGIVGVGQMETNEFHASLLEHLGHPHPAVREAAVENIRDVSSSDCFDGIIALLDDPDPDVVQAAISQLGRVRDPARLETMESRLRKGPLRQWEGLLAALIIQGDEGRQSMLVEACRERLLSANRNLVATDILARQDKSSAVDLLTDQLEVENRVVRSGVIGLLGHLGDTDVVVDLLDRLAEGNQEARENAIELLENMADGELLNHLLPLLEEDSEEQMLTARHLSGWEAATVDEVIQGLLNTPNSWTRMAAAWAATSLGKGDLLSALQEDSAAPVRETVRKLHAKAGGVEVTTNANSDSVGTPDHLPLTTMDKITFLKQSPFFAALPLEELYHIALSMEEEAVDVGSRVIKEGTPGDKMYIVVRGRLEVRKFEGVDNEEGQLIASLGERQVFGEMALLDDEPRSASVLAVEDAHLLSLRRSNLERLLRRYASIAFNMMRILSQRLRNSMAA